MKHNHTLALIALALATLACNALANNPFSNLKTGPIETFSIDEPVISSATITDVMLTMAPSSARLALAGGANGLVEGEISYNVTEWKPAPTTIDTTLRILQEPHDDNLYNVSEQAVNEWNLKLGDGVANVRVECLAGDLTLDFADTVPNGVTVAIGMGAVNLQVAIPDGIGVTVTVIHGPTLVLTKGAWTKNGNIYSTDGSDSTWTINIEMGTGNLSLQSK